LENRNISVVAENRNPTTLRTTLVLSYLAKKNVDELLNTVKMTLVQVSGKTDPLLTETFSISFPRKKGVGKTAQKFYVSRQKLWV